MNTSEPGKQQFQKSSKNLTWLDPNTGLEWQRETPGRMTWYEGRDYASSLILDGKSDWRLPALKELASLLDRTIYRPVMRVGIPFRDSLPYWSATAFRRQRHSAWTIMFEGAYVLSYYKINRYYIRCVRNGPRILQSITP